MSTKVIQPARRTKAATKSERQLPTPGDPTTAGSTPMLLPTTAWLQALPERHKAAKRLRDQFAFHAERLVRRQLQWLATTGNVDPGSAPADRATAFHELAREALQQLDGRVRDEIAVFLVRTGWHEGADLTKRTQHPGGPGRGFIQFEPGAAKDAIGRAEQKRWLPALATAAATRGADLKSAAARLALGQPWPTGNLIESSLLSYDLFGLMLARSYLSTTSAAIPADLEAQADYWEKWWHRVTAPQKKAKWIADAKRLDGVMGWA